MAHSYDVMKICVEAYLGYVRNVEDELDSLEAQVRRAEERLELCGVSYEGATVKSSSDPDRIGLAVSALQEAREEYAGRILAYEDELAEARDILAPIHPNAYIVKLHIVDGLTWAEVGRKMKYSERAIRYRAADGIEEIYGVMPEEFRKYGIPNAQV